MRFINFMTESLGFIDLPLLNRRFRSRFGKSLTDCGAEMKLSGGEVLFRKNELDGIHMNADKMIDFFKANGWNECGGDDTLVFRQAREPEENIKPYYETEMYANDDYISLYRELCGRLKFIFYHISTATPESLYATGGLRCRKGDKVKYERRIYMVSPKMALKTLILDGSIDDDTKENEVQNALNARMSLLADEMAINIRATWSEDHDSAPKTLYCYSFELPENWPVFKDPEFNDDDEFSACACFTTQNIPVKFINFVRKYNHEIQCQ